MPEFRRGVADIGGALSALAAAAVILGLQAVTVSLAYFVSTAAAIIVTVRLPGSARR